MPGSQTAELIFIAAMMVLILVVSFGALYFFAKTYRKEMAEKKVRMEERESARTAAKERETNGAS